VPHPLMARKLTYHVSIERKGDFHMDLFGVYPELRDSRLPALAGRALRLISISGFVYDETAFYLELSEPRQWGRLSEGPAVIGVRAPQVQPDASHPPHQALLQYVRQNWHAAVELFAAGHGYLLDESGGVHVLTDVAANIPYFFILTLPRLGGGEMPDALVQAVYLLPLQRIRAHHASVALLQVERDKLSRFLEPESWSLAQVRAEPWIGIAPVRALPDDAHLRPVLALRGLRRLLENGALPGMPAL
jgi:hypothetical protein